MRKKTIRKMSPEAREVAKISNEILSAGRRLRNLAKKMNYQNAFQQNILKRGLKELSEKNLFLE